MRSYILALCAAAAVALLPAASGKTVTVSASGTWSGEPIPGVPLFVPGGTPFSIHFSFDTASTGTVTSSPFSNLTEYAGATAQITIGGVAYTAPSRLQVINFGPMGNEYGVLAGLFYFDNPPVGTLQGLTLLSQTGAGLLPGGALPDASFFSGPGFSAQVYNLIDPRPETGDGQLGFNFSAEPLTIGATSGVPEPAIWLALLAGFGLVAGVMRRHRSPARIALSA